MNIHEQIISVISGSLLNSKSQLTGRYINAPTLIKTCPFGRTNGFPMRSSTHKHEHLQSCLAYMTHISQTFNGHKSAISSSRVARSRCVFMKIRTTDMSNRHITMQHNMLRQVNQIWSFNRFLSKILFATEQT